MNYFFVSDNRFYLTGLQRQKILQAKNVVFQNAKEIFHNDKLSSGDVVALYITDVLLRGNILRRLNEIGCRVILLLKMIPQHEYVYNGRFPWLISDKISAENLFFTMESAGRSVFLRRSISENEAFIIRSLCNGYSILQLNELTGLSDKYIYSLRRNLISNYNLQGHNAATTLVCRDIIRLSRTITS